MVVHWTLYTQPSEPDPVKGFYVTRVSRFIHLFILDSILIQVRTVDQDFRVSLKLSKWYHESFRSNLLIQLSVCDMTFRPETSYICRFCNPQYDNLPILCLCSKNLTGLGKGYIFVGEGPWIKPGIKVDIHDYQNNHIPGYYISLWFSNMFWKKNQISTSNCLESDGSLKFFSPTQTGGSLLEIVTRPVVDQAGYQGWYSWLSK